MYRRGIAGQTVGFVMVQPGGAAYTGGVTAYRVVDGGAQEAVEGAVTDHGGGQFTLAAAAADLAGAHVSFLLTAAGAVPCERTVTTTAADPGDGDAFGLANLDAPVSGVLGRVVLTIAAPSARWTDADENQLTEVTAAQALAALLAVMTGDRSGVGTREITAAVAGAAGCSVTASRVTRSTIAATVVVPTAS